MKPTTKKDPNMKKLSLLILGALLILASPAQASSQKCCRITKSDATAHAWGVAKKLKTRIDADWGYVGSCWRMNPWRVDCKLRFGGESTWPCWETVALTRDSDSWWYDTVRGTCQSLYDLG